MCDFISEGPSVLLVRSSASPVQSSKNSLTYLWLVGNGGMRYNFNYYYYHSSIPYQPKVGLA